MKNIIASLLSNPETRENSLPQFQKEAELLTPWLD